MTVADDLTPNKHKILGSNDADFTLTMIGHVYSTDRVHRDKTIEPITYETRVSERREFGREALNLPVSLLSTDWFIHSNKTCCRLYGMVVIMVSDYDRRQYDGRKWRRQLLLGVNYRRLQSSKPVMLTYGILIESLNTIGTKCWDEQPKGWYTYLSAFNRRMLAIRNFAPTEGCWGLYDAQR